MSSGAVRAAASLTAVLLYSSALVAQSPGQAEVATQSYALGGSGQPQTRTSGLSASLSQVLSGVGLFTGAFEAYGSNGAGGGTIFGRVQGVPFLGRHWNLAGGDFRLSSSLVENPFLNIYAPEISARGFHVAATRAKLTYQVFAGEETVSGGARISFRVLLPQRVLGASVQQTIGARWTVGARLLSLSTSSSAPVSHPELFGPSRDFKRSQSLLVQSSYSVAAHLKVFAEASYAVASTLTSDTTRIQPMSVLAGPAWESERFGLHANYVRQGTAYLPLLGYFVGDREGPYADVHYRPAKGADLYGSSSAYSSNLEKNPAAPTFRSLAHTAGGSVGLPWRLTAGGSISSLHLVERDPSRPATASDNRQVSVSLSRPIARHSLRGSVIDMTLNTNGTPQTQRLIEAGDTFNWNRLTVGGAVRAQHAESTTETRNTVFVRGSLSASIRHLTAYGSFEKGDDLVNTSVFSLNSLSSTVLGVSAPVRGWTLELEAFRNRLNTALNAENAFLFGPNGLSLGTQLAASDQWSIYLRIGRQIRWGKALPNGNSIEHYAALAAPLMGSVQGRVNQRGPEGLRPAANIVVSLDGQRVASTDSFGRYQFPNVPEGDHELGIDLEQLPADYDPDSSHLTRLHIEPRHVALADFDVVALTQLVGRISAPAGIPVETIVIRLTGTNRYTTPEVDGRFVFSNLRADEHEITIDKATVPDDCLLVSPDTIRVPAASIEARRPVEFELREKPQSEKPVRTTVQPPIHVDTIKK